MNAKQAAQRARLEQKLKGYDRTEDILSKEYYISKEASDLIDRIDFDTSGHQQKKIKNLINSLFKDERKELSQTLSTADQTVDEEMVAKLAETKRSKMVYYFNLNGNIEFLSDSKVQHRYENNSDDQQIEFTETVARGSRAKSKLIATLIKANNLSEEMGLLLEEYLIEFDIMEAMKGDMALYNTMSHKLSMNQSLLRGVETKKFTPTNKPQFSSRPLALHAPLKLAKHVTPSKGKNIQQISNFLLLNNPQRSNYLDNMQKNQLIRVKKAQAKAQAGEAEKLIDTMQDEDFELSNQFPIFSPMNFDDLGPYGLYFLKKFVTKFVLQLYIREIQSKSKDPFEMEDLRLELLDNEGGWNTESDSKEFRAQVKAEGDQAIEQRKFDKLRELNYMRLRPFKMDPKAQGEDELLRITSRTPNEFYNYKPYLRMKALKYHKKKDIAARKVFAVYEFRLFWFSSSSSSASGYVDLRTCRIGVGTHNENNLLVLHPRNNGDSLLIILNDEGQALRKELLEIKAWIELYDYYFNDLLKKDQITNYYNPIDMNFTAREVDIRVLLYPQNLYSDAYFIRLMNQRVGNLTSLTISYVIFSPDGIQRMIELLEETKNIKYLHLESNYLDEMSMETMLDTFMKSSVDKLETLKLVKNKINDSVILNVFDQIASAKSSPLSTPLKELNISYAGLGDNIFLGLVGIFANYAHEDYLFKLDFSGNLISDRGLLLLSEQLVRYPMVSTITLRNLQGIDPQKNNLKPLIENLALNKSVREIDFRGNTISAKTVKSIINYLGNSNSIYSILSDFDLSEILQLPLSKYSNALSTFRFNLLIEEKEDKGDEQKEMH